MPFLKISIKNFITYPKHSQIHFCYGRPNFQSFTDHAICKGFFCYFTWWKSKTICALSEILSLSCHPVKPLASFFSNSSKRLGTWTTTPLPVITKKSWMNTFCYTAYYWSNHFLQAFVFLAVLFSFTGCPNKFCV